MAGDPTLRTTQEERDHYRMATNALDRAVPKYGRGAYPRRAADDIDCLLAERDRLLADAQRIDTAWKAELSGLLEEHGRLTANLQQVREALERAPCFNRNRNQRIVLTVDCTGLIANCEKHRALAAIREKES
jgi:multidrug resistance efflux pump